MHPRRPHSNVCQLFLTSVKCRMTGFSCPGRNGMRRDPETLDRRTPHHGDRRRAALLEALDELLQENDLEHIAIADISARAGVTRSAFYFYFENKAACVAALGAEMYQEAI